MFSLVTRLYFYSFLKQYSGLFQNIKNKIKISYKDNIVTTQIQQEMFLTK